MGRKLKCEKWIRQHLERYIKDSDLLQLLRNMILEARDYKTQTAMDALLRTLDQVYHELE